MKEKEEAVRKLRADLAVKQREIEVDKALQESRSDPESVTSSLTSSTVGSGSASSAPKPPKTHESACGAAKLATAVEKPPPLSSRDVSDLQDDPLGSCKHVSSLFLVDSGSSSIACDDMATGSSSHVAGEGRASDPEASPVSEEESNKLHESRSIPSDAAVVNLGNSDSHRSGRFTNIVLAKRVNRACKKRPPGEATSLEGNFELDYEEVFAKSNIPQLVATTSGKIVTCE